jgi:hypothetical protein
MVVVIFFLSFPPPPPFFPKEEEEEELYSENDRLENVISRVAFKASRRQNLETMRRR